jgi:hypothetical protein
MVSVILKITDCGLEFYVHNAFFNRLQFNSAPVNGKEPLRKVLAATKDAHILIFNFQKLRIALHPVALRCILLHRVAMAVPGLIL